MEKHTAPLLLANKLTLSFAETTAVNALSLQLQRGEVLGLLGLNGAGKSSTLRMLAGVLAPSDGSVLIDGVSLQEQPLQAKQCIGYLPESAPLYTDMRVCDYLLYAARLRRMPPASIAGRIDALLSQLELQDFARRRIGKLSKGYKQRVGLAQALIHDPALLILDEPSSGLDPQQMRQMRELIRSLSADKGIVFSSHLLSEVTELCDQVSVLHHGRLIHTRQLDATQDSTGRIIVRFANDVEYSELLRLPPVEDADLLAAQTWALSSVAGQAAQLLPALVKARLEVLEFTPERHSLETMFSSLLTSESATAARWQDSE